MMVQRADSHFSEFFVDNVSIFYLIFTDFFYFSFAFFFCFYAFRFILC